MKESLTVVVLVVAGMACTLGCIGLWSARSADERRRAGAQIALALSLSLLAVGRWQSAHGVEVLSWWLMLLALPPLWPGSANMSAATTTETLPVAEEPGDA